MICELCGKDKPDTKPVFGTYPMMDSCYAYEIRERNACYRY